MNKIFILFLIFTLGCQAQKKIPKNYDFTPVMLHLSESRQHDSIGYNLVRAIPELLYPKILTGDLAIWETSDKKYILGAEQFTKLEKTADRPFVRNKDLFIHEFWKIFKKNYEFGVQGFTFTGTSKKGKTINYGYVDAPDIANLLSTEYIPCNANGSSQLTYWDALHSKTYQFNLIQFGNDNFKTNPRKSTDLQYQAVHDPKILRELTSIKSKKEIVYRVLPPSINSNSENKSFYLIMQDYLNKNKQTILNAGGAEYFKENLYKPWKIENITMTEVWTKYKNIPFQEFSSIEFFIDQRAIKLTNKQLEEMDVRINLQGFAEYVSEKRFSFLIEKINDQEMAAQNSDQLYNALLRNPWNKVR
ncbi:hypothetical protein N8368_03840 [Bacteroidia bacterium]|nr:hypothetical protein [Bacteroidia bacterium]